ncbi:hypothetical protein EV426DRAFT_290824 [Tirmania nivea]|nr:hypothetical protein EV426DRAFT_290824 [Tirmania nivea]
MCQYELWVYTRCRSSSPPVPPLPPLFPQQYLCLPPDQLETDSPTYPVFSLAHTWPHTAYYRVTKCLLSPECAPPSFSYLASPPPPSPRVMRKVAVAQTPSPGNLQPPRTQATSQEPSQPGSPLSGSTPHPECFVGTPSPQGNPITSHGTVPIRVRHSYCHTCYEILRETIDGDGELCFPIGSNNWLSHTGKSTGRCWRMDERAARGDVIVDLDYSTGIDWAAEFDLAAIGIPWTTSSTRPTTPLPQLKQDMASLLMDSPIVPVKSERELRAQETARELAREREAMKEKAAQLALRHAMSKEFEKRKARVAAENMRKRRWKGWEAWGTPYVVPSPRVAQAGAS